MAEFELTAAGVTARDRIYVGKAHQDSGKNEPAAGFKHFSWLMRHKADLATVVYIVVGGTRMHLEPSGFAVLGALSFKNES